MPIGALEFVKIGGLIAKWQALGRRSLAGRAGRRHTSAIYINYSVTTGLSLVPRISPDAISEIHRLSSSMDSAAIAAKLNLHRLEVQAILAHRVMREEVASNDAPIKTKTYDLIEQNEQKGTVERPISSPVAETDSGAEENEDRGLYLGDQPEFEEPVYWDPEAETNPHIMIVGESGSGKTYATQCLVAELAEAGVPSLIFDYGQSFELDTLHQVFKDRCNPREYRIGEEGLPLSPLQIFTRDVRGPNQVAIRVADVFDSVFRLGDVQKRVLIDALSEVYEKSGIKQANPKTWAKKAPGLMSVRDAIERIANDRESPHRNNAQGLAARLTTFFMLAAFNDAAWSWDDLIESKEHRVHILQFRGLEGKTQRVMVEVLLWHLFYHLKSHGQQRLRAFCVLDEAHHLSFRDTGPLQALLREARKFGIGIMFASQQPEDFTPVAYQNSAAKLVFQTTDPKLQVSKALIGKASNFERPEEIREVIGALEKGTALFMRGRRGSVVEIADFAKRSTFWSEAK